MTVPLGSRSGVWSWPLRREAQPSGAESFASEPAFSCPPSTGVKRGCRAEWEEPLEEGGRHLCQCVCPSFSARLSVAAAGLGLMRAPAGQTRVTGAWGGCFWGVRSQASEPVPVFGGAKGPGVRGDTGNGRDKADTLVGHACVLKAAEGSAGDRATRDSA